MAKAKSKAKTKTFSVHIVASVSENSVIGDVRAAIKREVSMGGETNFRWVPAEPPMSLRAQQWQATGDTVVDALQAKYPNSLSSDRRSGPISRRSSRSSVRF